MNIRLCKKLPYCSCGSTRFTKKNHAHLQKVLYYSNVTNFYNKYYIICYFIFFNLRKIIIVKSFLMLVFLKGSNKKLKLNEIKMMFKHEKCFKMFIQYHVSAMIYCINKHIQVALVNVCYTVNK